MTELTGKRVLITGSKGGIGFAVAKKFAEAGAELVLHARNESPEFIEAKTKLSKLSMADISGVFGDFSNQDACKQIFETLMKDQKTVDDLFHLNGHFNIVSKLQPKRVAILTVEKMVLN